MIPARSTANGAGRNWLIAAAALSVAGSAVHFACIAGGPSWYRFLGAGRRIVHFAEQGSPLPDIYAAIIGCLVAGWALYAASGAGLIARLPLRKTALVLISGVCLLRAAALPLLLRYAQDSTRGAAFLIWSSAVMLLFGLCFAIGTALAWRRL